MMTVRPTLRILLATAALALVLPTATMVNAKDLTIGLNSDATLLDPQAGEELSSNIMFYHIFDPLVRRDGEMNFGPGLAESWSQKDEKTWVFKLRPDVKFHNGATLKASDVVFTIERLKGSVMSNLSANIASATAVDDLTVEIATPGPYAALPNDLAAILILNEEYLKAVGDVEFGLKPMGTGPYMLKEWVKEDHLTLEAFPDYFAGPAKIDTVVFRPITNPATRTAALLTGELDVVQDLAVRDVERVKAEPGITVLTRPSLLNILLALDVREKSPTIALDKNPMTDLRVREAIARAIDVATIDKVVMNGLATPSAQFVPESHVGFVDGADFGAMYPFDIARAKELMAEAGYADGFAMTLDATNNRYVNDAQIAQALTSMLAQIGIELTLNLMPKSNFWGYIRVPSDNSSVIMSGWDVPSGDAGSMYNALYYSRDKKEGYGEVNRTSYSNPQVDDLLDKADSTANMDERDGFLQDATKLLLADIPMIPVHYEQDIYASHDGVTFTPRTDKFIWAYEMDVSE